MAPKLPRITAAELLRALRLDGWAPLRQSGSHVQLGHPSKPGRVTISGKSSDDLAPGTLNSIFKQAGFMGQDMKEVH